MKGYINNDLQPYRTGNFGTRGEEIGIRCLPADIRHLLTHKPTPIPTGLSGPPLPRGDFLWLLKGIILSQRMVEVQGGLIKAVSL